MDSTRTIVMPTMVILTLFIIYYRYYSKNKKEKTPLYSKNIEKVEEKKELKKKNEELEEEEIEKEEKIEEREDNKKWKLTFDKLFDKFCEYIQKNKLVSIDAIAEKLNKTKEDTIKFLRELEKEGKTIGFVGDDGEYFFLTMKELDLLNNLLISSKKKDINEEELQKQFDEIIKDRNESLF